jgi:hypothetical protein
VNQDLREGPQFFNRGDSADVIQMRVRQSDGLKLKPVSLKRARDQFRLVARINTDGTPRLLAPDDARVLLKRSDGQLFNNHKQSALSSQPQKSIFKSWLLTADY